jgi:carboxypeptidase Q
MCIFIACVLATGTILAQRFGGAPLDAFPTDDPVLRAIWHEEQDSSHLVLLAHQLFDVIGPRLTGTPQMKQAGEWISHMYQEWGIDPKVEPYGKWLGWERGTTHIDLLRPRVRTLEGTMLAWSPPTKGGGIAAHTILLPDFADSLAFGRWLPLVKGKFVLISMPQPTGRPDKNWEEFATPESFDSLKAMRKRMTDNWARRIKCTGCKGDSLHLVLEEAGAAGIITNTWSSGWGVDRIFGTRTQHVPVVDLSLEDYGLVYRLTEAGDDPVVRIAAESKFLGAVPAFNTLGKIPGSTLPNETVMLSAHLDSWDGASGATDNGTGTLIMLEAMRVLKKVYPHPRRSILAGHWGSEEQGLNGSKAFVKDHPEIMEKLQVLFNQDNGTGRVISMSPGGLINAGEMLARWLSRIPRGVTQYIRLDVPGMPAGGGTDNASFIAAGAPGFGLGSNNWDYFSYTWHTNRDTYDKLVFDDLRNNVLLVASLVYLASEDTQFVPRDRRLMPTDSTTRMQRLWPPVQEPERLGRLKHE